MGMAPVDPVNAAPQPTTITRTPSQETLLRSRSREDSPDPLALSWGTSYTPQTSARKRRRRSQAIARSQRLTTPPPLDSDTAETQGEICITVEASPGVRMSPIRVVRRTSAIGITGSPVRGPRGEIQPLGQHARLEFNMEHARRKIAARVPTPRRPSGWVEVVDEDEEMNEQERQDGDIGATRDYNEEQTSDLGVVYDDDDENDAGYHGSHDYTPHRPAPFDNSTVALERNLEESEHFSPVQLRSLKSSAAAVAEAAVAAAAATQKIERARLPTPAETVVSVETKPRGSSALRHSARRASVALRAFGALPQLDTPITYRTGLNSAEEAAQNTSPSSLAEEGDVEGDDTGFDWLAAARDPTLQRTSQDGEDVEVHNSSMQPGVYTSLFDEDGDTSMHNESYGTQPSEDGYESEVDFSNNVSARDEKSRQMEPVKSQQTRKSEHEAPNTQQRASILDEKMFSSFEDSLASLSSSHSSNVGATDPASTYASVKDEESVSSLAQVKADHHSSIRSVASKYVSSLTSATIATDNRTVSTTSSKRNIFSRLARWLYPPPPPQWSFQPACAKASKPTSVPDSAAHDNDRTSTLKWTDNHYILLDSLYRRARQASNLASTAPSRHSSDSSQPQPQRPRPKLPRIFFAPLPGVWRQFVGMRLDCPANPDAGPLSKERKLPHIMTTEEVQIAVAFAHEALEKGVPQIRPLRVVPHTPTNGMASSRKSRAVWRKKETQWLDNDAGRREVVRRVYSLVVVAEASARQ